MFFQIRWNRLRRPVLSPRVKVALMSVSMLTVTLAGSAAQRWA